MGNGRSGWDAFWLVIASLLVALSGAFLVVVLAWSSLWTITGYAFASLFSSRDSALPESSRTPIPYEVRAVDTPGHIDCTTTRCWTWEITPSGECPSGTPYARVATVSSADPTASETTDHALYAEDDRPVRTLSVQRGTDSDARVIEVFCWGTW